MIIILCDLRRWSVSWTLQIFLLKKWEPLLIKSVIIWHICSRFLLYFDDILIEFIWNDVLVAHWFPGYLVEHTGVVAVQFKDPLRRILLWSTMNWMGPSDFNKQCLIVLVEWLGTVVINEKIKWQFQRYTREQKFLGKVLILDFLIKFFNKPVLVGGFALYNP